MKLSIVTINLNNCEGLRRTIESVVSQTYQGFEWVVIDGGSTDGSKELIESYAEHFAYHVSEPDKGIYNAMNKGVRASSGDYLLFLNSGDCLADKDVLQSFVDTFPTADVVYGNAIVVDANGSEVSKWVNPAKLRLSYFWACGLNHQSTFIHKRCFERFLYNENNKIVSDTELFFSLMYYGYSFVKYDSYITRFDNTGVSFTTKYNEIEGVYSRILPEGIKADYDEIIMFRDVDLAWMIKYIIRSNRFFRYVARIFVYPIYYLCKFTCKR